MTTTGSSAASSLDARCLRSWALPRSASWPPPVRPARSAPAASTAAATAAASASAAAAAASDASALPACVVVPELTEGPYYVDEKIERSDIRIDTADGQPVEGAVLRIDWVVSQVDGSACIPLEGVLVDVWHCDALGEYSDVQNEIGHDFLRGYVHTDANGKATITTIYPGWYSGRAVHIHFKIRTDPAQTSGFEFTSQLFFDDAFSDQVYGSGVYASKGPHDVQNADDGIYQQSQGMTLLNVAQGRRRLRRDLRGRGPDDLAVRLAGWGSGIVAADGVDVAAVVAATVVPAASRRASRRRALARVQIDDPAMTAPSRAPRVRPRTNRPDGSRSSGAPITSAAPWDPGGR